MSMRIRQYHSLRESGIDDEVMSGDSDHRDLDTKGTEFWGWVCVGFGSVLFAVFSFSAIVSKILPTFENPILAAIQRDKYYCFLVPLTLPVLVVAVYFHWLSMKLFKHA
ncbi:hypothetical protein Droror1_Dr00001622 [Drosera rotundifolia]